MTPERLAAVQAISERALETSPQGRAAYLDQACGADAELRREVDALLAGKSAPSSPAVSPELAPGIRIGKYVLQEYLGGGMSSVYRAHDTVIDRSVVVKLLSQFSAHDDNARERFLREAKLLASVRHDHIVHIYDYGETDDNLQSPRLPFMVMEHLVGEDLASAIANKRTGSIEHRVEIIRQAAAALAHVHQFGIVHRDIKPANIHLEKSGRVKLMDFGIARTQVSSLTETGTMLGTPHYISPEQLRGEAPTTACDIYSFGVLMYELLTGSRPFDGDTVSRVLFQIINEPTPLRPLREHGVADHLVKLIEQMMQKQPHARPSGFAEVVDRLNGKATAGPAAAKRQWSLSWGFAFVVLLIAGATGWLWLQERDLPSPIDNPPAAAIDVEAAPVELAAEASPPAANDNESPSSVAPAAEPVRPPPVLRASVQPATVTPAPAPPPVEAQREPVPATVAAPRSLGPTTAAAVREPVLGTTAAARRDPILTTTAAALGAVDPAAEAWNAIQSSQDAAGFESYLRRYPNSPFADIARVRLEDLRWSQVATSTDVATLRGFLDANTNSAHAPEATARINAFEGAAAQQGIQRALSRYEAAYASKNLNEIRAVRPGLAAAELNQIRTLYGAARSITLELRPVSPPQVMDGRATVICARNLLFVDNGGTERRTTDRVTVRLLDTGTNWIIEDLR